MEPTYSTELVRPDAIHAKFFLVCKWTHAAIGSRAKLAFVFFWATILFAPLGFAQQQPQTLCTVISGQDKVVCWANGGHGQTGTLFVPPTQNVNAGFGKPSNACRATLDASAGVLALYIPSLFAKALTTGLYAIAIDLGWVDLICRALTEGLPRPLDMQPVQQTQQMSLSTDSSVRTTQPNGVTGWQKFRGDQALSENGLNNSSSEDRQVDPSATSAIPSDSATQVTTTQTAPPNQYFSYQGFGYSTGRHYLPRYGYAPFRSYPCFYGHGHSHFPVYRIARGYQRSRR